MDKEIVEDVHKEKSIKKAWELFLSFAPGISIYIISDGLLTHFEFSSRTKNIVLVVFSVWFFMVLFSFFRNALVSYKDSKQITYVPKLYGKRRFMRSTNREYQVKFTDEIIGFIWKVETGIPSSYYHRVYTSKELQEKEIQLFDICGPHCPRDHCLLIEEKTYFGNYNLICPNCDYQIKSKFNSNTLLRNAILIIVSRKKIEFVDFDLIANNSNS